MLDEHGNKKPSPQLCGPLKIEYYRYPPNGGAIMVSLILSVIALCIGCFVLGFHVGGLVKSFELECKDDDGDNQGDQEAP